MADLDIKSVPAMFLHRVRESGQKPAFQYPKGEDGWQTITWQQTLERVKVIAAGLQSLGIGLEDRCAILSSTRMEWIFADLGILCAGAATTTIYPSNTAKECTYIIADSGTKVVFAEDDDQVAKLLAEKANIPEVTKVVTYDGKAGHGGWVITLAELGKLGKKYLEENPDSFDETVEALKPNHLATLIYTSGTTGMPKGVELVHDCWVSTALAIEDLDIVGIDDHQYLWLPLAHSFGKVLQSMHLLIGFLTTVDGRIPKLVDNLGVVKPTFMAAAPRIFEKVHNKVVSGAKEGGGLKYKIFTWAIGVGREASKLRQQRREPSGLLAAKFKIANKLVFSKLKARFGGRIRFFISGSAPLSREMAEFFHASDILILEGYGLTESSAASFVNLPKSFEFGTVGPPLANVEVKIAEEDGEVLLRGRGIMRGYHNLPEETKESLDAEGYLHTGDIGEITPTGLLRITDRKKDLIKTSGGKYVAPQSLESSLKAQCPYISQVIVHGNMRNYCTALVTLDPEGIANWQEANGLAGKSYGEVVTSEPAHKMVQAAVDALNSSVPSYSTIKRFALLPMDLSIEEGDLTPSMKVKRKAVEVKYREILDSFYTGTMAEL